MPPSSRKRNKGKERKTKQQAKKEDNVRAVAHRLWRGGLYNASNDCEHGCKVAISDNHPVSTFMDQFYINFTHIRMSVQQTLREIFKSHRHILNNESYRNAVIRIFIRIGTNFLVREEGCDLAWPSFIAQSIVALECYNGTGDIDLVLSRQVIASKWKDLSTHASSLRRDLLKFYRKRISCKCLKKRHLEARKTTLKFGICEYCKEEKERVSLSVCSRCMIDQYCSRECQLADWHGHKQYCNAKYVSACKRETEEQTD